MSWLTYDELQAPPHSLKDFQIIDNLNKLHPHDRFSKQPIPCPDFCHLYHKHWKRANQTGRDRKEEHEEIKEAYEKTTATDPNAISWDHFYMPESEEDRNRVLGILKSTVFRQQDAEMVRQKFHSERHQHNIAFTEGREHQEGSRPQQIASGSANLLSSAVPSKMDATKSMDDFDENHSKLRNETIHLLENLKDHIEGGSLTSRWDLYDFQLKHCLVLGLPGYDRVTLLPVGPIEKPTTRMVAESRDFFIKRQGATTTAEYPSSFVGHDSHGLSPRRFIPYEFTEGVVPDEYKTLEDVDRAHRRLLFRIDDVLMFERAYGLKPMNNEESVGDTAWAPIIKDVNPWISISELWFRLIADPHYGQKDNVLFRVAAVKTKLEQPLSEHYPFHIGFVCQHELVHLFCRIGLGTYDSKSKQPVFWHTIDNELTRESYPKYKSEIDDLLIKKDELKAFLKEQGLPSPAFLEERTDQVPMEKQVYPTEQVSQQKATAKNQIDHNLARQRAVDYWKMEPGLSLSGMVKKIQYKHKHDGNPFFTRDYPDRTITEWIRDLSPSYSPSKRGRKKKSI